MAEEKWAALAARCEQATGPDHALDLAIAEALYPSELVNYAPAMWLERNGGFVGSLDAAMTLVPEGWNTDTGSRPTTSRFFANLARPEHDPLLVGKYDGRSGASLALALCAAALRARAA